MKRMRKVPVIFFRRNARGETISRLSDLEIREIRERLNRIKSRRNLFDIEAAKNNWDGYVFVVILFGPMTVGLLLSMMVGNAAPFGIMLLLAAIVYLGYASLAWIFDWD